MNILMTRRDSGRPSWYCKNSSALDQGCSARCGRSESFSVVGRIARRTLTEHTHRQRAGGFLGGRHGYFCRQETRCEGGNDCVRLGEICFRRGDHRFDDGHNCFVSINDRIQSGDDHVRTINNQDELGHDRLRLGDHDLQYGNNRFVPINNRFRYGDNYSRSARPELADSPGLDVRPK